MKGWECKPVRITVMEPDTIFLKHFIPQYNVKNYIADIHDDDDIGIDDDGDDEYYCYHWNDEGLSTKEGYFCIHQLWRITDADEKAAALQD